jgi:catechol 2,3-dioxygenase-like lactoylglutathione lyase family enzyme
MIHHVSVGTNDVGRSKRFYDAVLPLLGILPMAEDEGGLGYGSGTFHFGVQVPVDGKAATVGNGTHIAFAVEDRLTVDRFHKAAMQHGGGDDGATAPRGSVPFRIGNHRKDGAPQSAKMSNTASLLPSRLPALPQPHRGGQMAEMASEANVARPVVSGHLPQIGTYDPQRPDCGHSKSR